MAGETVNLSPLDSVRRFFGRPTLLEQMKAEKVAKARQPTAQGVRRTTAGAFQQRQETLDAAMQELRRQSGGR